jgi:hypothetical protein
MLSRKLAASDARKSHPSGRAVVILSTIVVLLLLLGLVLAAVFLVPTSKRPEVKEVKKSATSALTPRILSDPSFSRREKVEPHR